MMICKVSENCQSSNRTMGVFIMVNGKVILDMVLESKLIVKETGMKEIGRITNNMDRVPV